MGGGAHTSSVLFSRLVILRRRHVGEVAARARMGFMSTNVRGGGRERQRRDNGTSDPGVYGGQDGEVTCRGDGVPAMFSHV